LRGSRLKKCEFAMQTRDEKCKAFLAYWEHKLPEGQKSYSKTKPIQKSEFSSLKEWWDKRVENEQAWRVPVEKIAENGWNLDIKNPCVKEEEVTHTTAELLDKLSVSFKKSDELIAELRNGLAGK
ncbi:MAG: SAM-dependent methyltransferase, partial [Treponema porcinum]|nr:SAM-dependent methyltransferase [Treponema porcinum]